MDKNDLWNDDGYYAVFLDTAKKTTVTAEQTKTKTPKCLAQHGHWIRKEITNEELIWDCYKCSECGEVQEHRSKYCPDCGAIMDGEEEFVGMEVL